MSETNKTAGHTQLPWQISEANKKGGREIVGADGSTVAKLTALDLPNAELIVKSVNYFHLKRILSK